MSGEANVIVGGLALAVVAGLAGGGFNSVSSQSVLFAVSSIGLVVAAATLALHHTQQGHVLVSAGFLVLSVAEVMVWAGGRPRDPGYRAAFGGGVLFYVPALLLAAVPPAYPWVVRGFGISAAAMWAVGAYRHLTGAEFSDTGPLAVSSYVVMSAFFVGVAWVTVSSGL